MALNNLGLGFVFTAQDRASGAIGRVGTQFERTAGRARLGTGVIRAGLLGIGAAAAATAAGVGTLMGAFRLANVAGEFGQTMARVGALTRATAQDMEALRGAAIQAGIATQFSPREAAEGLAELGVRGFNAQESMAALSSSLDLAAGGQISVARSSSTLAAALRVFSLSADQAGITTDQLLRISHVTGLLAGDLEIALGNVSRGAGVAQQSIEEMLPAIGLVRNTGVEASSAATGVSTALIRMAQSASRFRRIGVEVTDAQGSFRPFLDVVRETDVALRERFPNAAARAAEATRLFGVRGLGAFQAVANQLNGQIRDTEGNVLSASDAITFLRDSMTGASGTAAEFRDRMLDTFEGQQTLLRGTVETLQTVTGESFGKVFRPFVEGLTGLLNAFIRVWTAMPEPVRTAIGAIAVGFGALLTVFGSATGIGIAVALLIPFLEVIAGTLGIVALALTPVIAGIAAVATAVAAFGLAVRQNVGGIGDFFEENLARARLVFNGLRQLFADGGFSGEVRDEMSRAENQGIRRFAINVFAIGFRVKRVFAGIVAGVSSGINAARPAFEAFMGAMRELGSAFGFVSEGAEELGGSNSNDFFATGKQVGEAFARVLGVVVRGIAGVVRFFAGMVRVFRAGFEFFRPVFDSLGEAVGRLGAAFGMLLGQTEGSAESSARAGGMFGQMGEFIGGVLITGITLAVGGLTFMIDALAGITAAIAIMVSMGRVQFNAFRRFVDSLVIGFENLGDQVTIVVNGILADALRLVRAIPAPIRSRLGLGDVGATEQRLLADQRLARDRVAVRNSAGAVRAAERLTGTAGVTARSAAGANHAAALRNLAREMGNRPVRVESQLVVDGEVLARTSETARRSDDAAGFRRPVDLGPED